MGSVPEPSVWAMLIAGFGLVGFQARRRRIAALTTSA
nr:PEPxxWA-CTERM sorting domain-containing protein [Sandarakinorhabdus limnophila]